MQKQKQKNANAKTATEKKPKGADTPTTHGKPTGRKAQTQKADNAGLPELLRELIAGVKVVADRVESVRRTLWRMSEVRNYENKGAKPTEKNALREAVADLFTPMAEEFIADIKSGRVNTAKEYDWLRAFPDWEQFVASYQTGAPEAGTAKTEGGAE